MSGYFLVCGERRMCEEQRQYTMNRVLFFLCRLRPCCVPMETLLQQAAAAG
jgi:hypothetical protein